MDPVLIQNLEQFYETMNFTQEQRGLLQTMKLEMVGRKTLEELQQALLAAVNELESRIEEKLRIIQSCFGPINYRKFTKDVTDISVLKGILLEKNRVIDGRITDVIEIIRVLDS